MSSDNITRFRAPEVDRVEEDHPSDPIVGRWFHCPVKDWGSSFKGKYLGCVTTVGSNFAEVTFVGGRVHRYSMADFYNECERELDPHGRINKAITKKQERVASLMGQVQDVTRQLQVGQPGTVNESQALARVDGTRIETYKEALVKAKTETLPALFKDIKEETERLANWMKATLIEMNANITAQQPLIKAVEKRIFNVDLYAGMSEELVKIQDGKPAATDAPIHLFQRRHYMDEECLAGWERGGMDFRMISGFDRWLLKPANLNRVLPFDRSVVAFRVRRNDRSSDTDNMGEMLQLMEENRQNKRTYLYFRNGEQVHRLTTTIDFGDALFPDMASIYTDKGGKRYVGTGWAGKYHGFSEPVVISEGDYLARVQKDLDDWDAAERRAEERRKKPGEPQNSWLDHGSGRRGAEADKWEVFDKDFLYFDEVQDMLNEKMEEHNRLVLLLQGVLDRTETFLPHPKWELWGADFGTAIKLVYDKDFALVAGPEPVVADYIAKANKTLKAGCMVVGQQREWMRQMARQLNKENEERGLNYNDREFYKPRNNPGPGMVAKATRISDGKVHFSWERPTERYPYEHLVRDHCKVHLDRVLNVEAYKLGDYLLFFSDPRVRAKYTQWAPLLIAAEEEHQRRAEEKKAWQNRIRETEV